MKEICAVRDVYAGEAAYARHRRRGEKACAPCLRECARVEREGRNTRQCAALNLRGERCARTTVETYCGVHR